MKISNLAPLLVIAVAMAQATVEIPQHHHERFLQDISTLEQELAAWKRSEAGQFALENGFYTEPAAQSGSSAFTTESDASDDENLRRLFLTKLSIAENQKSNPDAILSIDSPFTLMTDAEFEGFVGSSIRESFDTEQDTGIAVNMTTAMEEQERSLKEMATSVDWSTSSACVAPVKNQLNCGACWAFSAIGALESAYCLKTGHLELFSEQQLINCDKYTHACTGGVPSYALQYVMTNGGVCTEAAYPYTSGRTVQPGKCNAVSCPIVNVGIKSVTKVEPNEFLLMVAIAKQPVAVAVVGGNAVWKQYTGGVVESCPTTELDHAVLAVGYDDKSFRLRNQWGSAWGDKGYINLKRAGDQSACGVVNKLNVYPVL